MRWEGLNSLSVIYHTEHAQNELTFVLGGLSSGRIRSRAISTNSIKREGRTAGCASAWWRYPRFQPLRTYGFKYLFASALLVMRIFAGSYSILPSTRSAITPRSIHSTNGAATLKLEQAASPPLQARIQSR